MANDLGKLNDILFGELGRLQDADKDEIESEAARAKQIRDLSETVIANANTVLKAVDLRERMSDATAEAVRVPKMLGGGE